MQTDLPRGMEQRGSRYYVLYKDKSGRFRRKSVGGDLPSALQEHQRLRSDSGAEPETMLADICERFVKKHRTRSKASTIANAVSDSSRLLRFLGNRAVSSLTAEDVEKFISFRRKQNVSVHAVNKDLRTLMSLMGWSNLATAEKYLHTDEDTKRKAATRSLL